MSRQGVPRHWATNSSSILASEMLFFDLKPKYVPHKTWVGKILYMCTAVIFFGNKNVKREYLILTSRFAHGNRLDEVLWSHVQLSFILYRAEHPETVLVGRHVDISIFKVKWTSLQNVKPTSLRRSRRFTSAAWSICKEISYLNVSIIRSRSEQTTHS